MIDVNESMECAAEDTYFKMMQDDGRIKCSCGNVFDENEGSIIHNHPYAMPVCPACFDAFMCNSFSTTWSSSVKKG